MGHRCHFGHLRRPCRHMGANYSSLFAGHENRKNEANYCAGGHLWPWVRNAIVRSHSVRRFEYENCRAFSLLVPFALGGMWIGFKLLDKLDQQRFRQITLLVLTIAGLNLLRKGLLVSSPIAFSALKPFCIAIFCPTICCATRHADSKFAPCAICPAIALASIHPVPRIVPGCRF